MSDQIPIDLRCHTEYKRIIVIVPHGVYCHNRNKECPGMDAITHTGQARPGSVCPNPDAPGTQ